MLQSERKVVSVLFADLAGYTALAETLDPEEVFGVVRPWLTDLRLVVEGHGGTVPQVMGDGFMAVFGVPTAHDDDAERAVRAALAMVSLAGQLASRQAAVAFPGLHVGVNTGEVIVAPSRESSGFAIVGDTVNVASRLAGLAVAGQVIVGASTRALTRGSLRYGPRRLLAAKGKARPLTTFEARGIRAAAAGRPGYLGSPAGPTSPFVDRTAIVRRLISEAEAVEAEHRSRVLVVVDEPGLGKTRLADELSIRLPGWLHLYGACHPYGQRLPLAAVAQAIATFVGIRPGLSPSSARRRLRRVARDARAATPGSAMAGLERQLETILGLHEATAGGDRPGPPGGAALDPRATVEPVIRALAAGRPTIVVLDDVHWADPDLQLLLEAIDLVPWSERVLFIALSRPEPDAWRRRLATVRLGALGARDARIVIASALGGDVPPAVVSRLVARAAGNPLFLEESARMLVETHALVRGPTGWQVADPKAIERVPATLRLVIAARLDRLSTAAKATLQDASVAGSVTWDALLEAMASDGRGRAPGSVRDSLAELEDRDILRRRSGSRVPAAVELAFKHDVIRDVAYESLPRSDRALRHRRIADWLQERVGEVAVAAIAHQYEQAWELGRLSSREGPDHDAARLASRSLRRWGDAVFALQPRLAEALYGRGLAIAVIDPAAVDGGELARLLIGRAEGLGELGRHREAIEAAERALDLVATTGQTDALGFALLALGRARSNLGEVSVARTLIERALVVFEATGPTVGTARAYHRLAEAQRFDDFSGELQSYRRAYGLYGRDRPERELVAVDLAYLLTVAGGREARDWLARATRLVARSGDERGVAALRRAAAYAAWYRGDLDGALGAALEARPSAAETGDRWVEVDSLLIEALVRTVADRPAQAERLIADLLRIADAAGARHLRALVLAAGARSAVRAGRPRQAMRRLATGRRILVELGVTMELAEIDLTTAAVHLDRGRWDRVFAAAASGEARAAANGWRALVPLGPLLRGRAHLGAGRLGEARRELRRARRLAASLGAIGLVATADAALAQVAALERGASPRHSVGTRRAMTTVDSLDRATSAIVGPLTGREPRAIDHETSGIVALHGGDPAAAAVSFGRAVRAWDELGLTVWQARAERLRAEALRLTRRRAAAMASEQRAAAILVAIESPLRSPR